MDATAARQYIADRCRADDDPSLTAGELDELLELAKIKDPAGRPPSDPAWVPTWDLEPAIGQGWLRKADKAAGMYDQVSLGDGLSFARQSLYKNCVAQAEAYGAYRPSAPDDRRSRGGAGSFYTGNPAA